MAKYYVNVNINGTFWYNDAEMKIWHRDDGPAVERVNGDKFWYIDGKLHREHGPAVEWADGDIEWYNNNQLHREDGPAIERGSGCKLWYKNGQRHRLDGPAVEYPDGRKFWLIDGKRHREDGPAFEWHNVDVQYWLNDKKLSKKTWEDAVRPAEEMTIGQIESLLGKRIKVVKE